MFAYRNDVRKILIPYLQELTPKQWNANAYPNTISWVIEHMAQTEDYWIFQIGFGESSRVVVIWMFKIELFVHKLSASVVFYRCLLGKGCTAHDEKSALFKAEGSGSLLLTDEAVLHADHYFASMAESRKGKGVELILPVDDVEMVYNKFKNIYPDHIESKIIARPWGKLDFRVIDPDGYYVRVTS
ncbi:hypothetical protein [Terribacillus sp. FSL K6-0262]